MTAVIRKTESVDHKVALYQEAEVFISDVINRSEEHFGADSYEVGYLLGWSYPSLLYIPSLPISI
jgi:hypothetical protein